MNSKYRWLTEMSQQFLERDYLVKGQTVDQRVDMICDTAEKILKKPGFAAAFKENIQKGWYSLSTPVWTNFGNDRGLPISCFGSYIADTMESIAFTWAEVCMMTKMGGGTSGYFGDLRHRGSTIKDNGESSGAVHFMQAFDNLINVVSQGKTRRGNFATYLPIDHPDIEEFLKIRTEGFAIQDLSYGVCVPDAWMEEMIEGDAQKRKIWAKVLESRSNTGYPYIFFVDNANNNTVDCYKDKQMRINHSNLCVTGDQRVVSDRGLKTAKELHEEGGELQLFDNEKRVSASSMKLVEKDADVYKVTLENGMSHTITAYHKLVTSEHDNLNREVKTIKACSDLKIGDRIAIQTHKGLFGNIDMPKEAFLLGLYQADGTQHKDTIMLDIWENDFDLEDEIQTYFNEIHYKYKCDSYIVENQFGNTQSTRKREPATFHECSRTLSGVRKRRLSARTLKKALNFEKGYVPDWIWEANEKTQWQYVRGLLYADGTVHVSKSQGEPIQLSLASIDKDFLLEIQVLFANLGLQNSLRILREAGEQTFPDNKTYASKDCYRLIIGNKNDALSIEKNTGFLSRKGICIEDRIYRDNTKKFYKIASIEHVGKEDVYCCTVDSEEHLWVCNGFVTHNCTEIMLPNNEEESFVCCLSSMNILYYDEWKDTNAVELMVCFLDAVMEEFIEKASKIEFMQRTVNFAKRHRALGIGWLGWHSYLQSKMIPWESMEAKFANVEIAKNIKTQAYEASAKLAQEYGEPDVCKGYGRRNSTLLAIAPTKSCTTPDTKFKDSDLNNIDYFEFAKRGGLDLHDIMSIEVEFDNEQIVKYRYDEMIKVERSGENITIMACNIAENDILNSSMPTVKKIKKTEKQWFELNPSVKIFTDNGINECNRFYFNGFEPTFELTFEDGCKYKFTGNHRLKNIENQWIHIDNIDVGFISNNKLKLIDKKYVGILPTMDMEVPDVHYYVLSNGIHSHNSAFIIGQVSEGIEPDKTNYYIKDLQKGKYTIKNLYLDKLLKEKGKDTEEIYNSILSSGGSVQHLSFLSENEKAVFKTFAEISPKEIVIQAAQRQKYIDQGQSLNLMIHPSVSIKDVNALVIEAWRLGIKSLYYQHSVNAAQSFTRSILSCANCES